MPDGSDRKQRRVDARLTIALNEMESAIARVPWVASPPGSWRVERESGGSHRATAFGPPDAPPVLVAPEIADDPDRAAAVEACARLMPEFVGLARATAWLASLRRSPRPEAVDATSHARMLFQAEAAIEAELAKIADGLVPALAPASPGNAGRAT